MRQRNREKFQKIGTALASMYTIYDKILNEFIVNVYYDILSPYPTDVVLDAIKKAIANCKFCPRPIDILEYIEGNSEDIAEIEAIKVVNAIMNIGSYQSVVFDDPVTQAVIESYGGWPDVCDECSDNEKTKWFKINFKNTYRAYAKQGIKKYGHLPGTIELQNRINGYEEFTKKPALIGEKEKALMVLEKGKEEKNKKITAFKDIKKLVLQ